MKEILEERNSMASVRTTHQEDLLAYDMLVVELDSQARHPRMADRCFKTKARYQTLLRN